MRLSAGGETVCAAPWLAAAPGHFSWGLPLAKDQHLSYEWAQRAQEPPASQSASWLVAQNMLPRREPL